MATRTLDLQNRSDKPSAPASVLSGDAYLPEVAEGYSWPMTTGLRPVQKQTWSLGGLGFCLLALTTITTPIVYLDPQRDLLHSGSSSIVWSIPKRRGRVISLREAHDIALRIVTDTERRLKAERVAEAHFTLGDWGEE